MIISNIVEGESSGNLLGRKVSLREERSVLRANTAAELTQTLKRVTASEK